jgi:hypothetical protein
MDNTSIPGLTPTLDYHNGVPAPYDKASDNSSQAISEAARYHERDMEERRNREVARANVFATFPDAPKELNALMHENQCLETWLSGLAAIEREGNIR